MSAPIIFQPRFPVFLSLVLVVQDQAETLADQLSTLIEQIMPLMSDLELVVIDNASHDDSVETLKKLTGPDGLPNLQVFALTQAVDPDAAAWAGLENALGDFIAVFDPARDDIAVLPKMLEMALSGSDIVFARNTRQAPQGLVYRLGHIAFNRLYQGFNGVHLASEAPVYRVLSRRVVNFVLQQPSPALFYRRLPGMAGFSRSSFDYSHPPPAAEKKPLFEQIDRGIRLLVSSTRAPVRLATSLSLFGALVNLFYSFYVLAIYFFKADVAPGWVTLSLQQSGMFFLFSLVLLVLGEYILHMGALSALSASPGQGQPYHVAQEFTSARITRHQRLNIEEVERGGEVAAEAGAEITAGGVQPGAASPEAGQQAAPRGQLVGGR